jgi:uncharacterized membrane protein YdjX (TVP38/TMEM64 family)
MQKKWTMVLTVVAVGLLGLALWLWRGEEVREAAGTPMEFLREAGPAAFFSGMALLPMIGFPMSPFILTAGAVFGPELGAGWVIIWAVGAVAVNVALSYWLAARGLRPVVEWGLARMGRGLPKEPVKSAWELTLALRVVPGTPFFLQSYLLGLARVPFGMYLAISTAVPAAYIAGMVLAGDALERGDKTMLMAGGIACAAAGAGLHLLRKRLTKRFRERRAAEVLAKETGGGGTNA